MLIMNGPLISQKVHQDDNHISELLGGEMYCPLLPSSCSSLCFYVMKEFTYTWSNLCRTISLFRQWSFTLSGFCWILLIKFGGRSFPTPCIRLQLRKLNFYRMCCFCIVILGADVRCWQAHIRTLTGRIVETILSLRFFIFQYGIVYKLNVQGTNTSLSVRAVSIWFIVSLFFVPGSRWYAMVVDGRFFWCITMSLCWVRQESYET